MGESLKRRLETEDRDGPENEPQKKRETEKGSEKTHLCESYPSGQKKHNLVAQNVIIEDGDDDDDS